MEAIRQGKPDALDDLYEQGRGDFLRWAGKRFVTNDPEDFLDIWQDSVIAFYEQVVSRKLTSLRCEVHTYLFAIGYRKLLKNNRKMRHILWKDEVDDALQKDPEILLFDWDEPWLEERKMLSAAIGQLGAQCQEILTQRYYHEKKIEELKTELNYNSANSVSATLSRCLKRLKEIIELAWKK